MSEKEHLFRCFKSPVYFLCGELFIHESYRDCRGGVFGITELDFYWDNFYCFPRRARFPGFLLYVPFIFYYTFFLIKSGLGLDQEPVGEEGMNTFILRVLMNTRVSAVVT